MKKFKKVLLLLLTILLTAGMFSGCGKRAETVENEFAELIALPEAAKVTPESMADAAEYMTKNLKQLPQERAAAMVSAYVTYAAQYINTDADAAQVQSLLPFFDAKTGEFDSAKLKKDENASAYYGLLERSYIEAALSENKVVLCLNYGALSESLHKWIPKALTEFYDLSAVITKTPATENAVLKVSYEEILRRAYCVEQMIRETKDQEIYPLIEEDTDWLYSTYLNILFMGTTNSPVFDYDTGAFSQEAETAYMKFYEENSDSVLAGAIHDYFRYLASIEYTMDYKDSDMSKTFFDNCSRIVTETSKKVKE